PPRAERAGGGDEDAAGAAGLDLAPDRIGQGHRLVDARLREVAMNACLHDGSAGPKGPGRTWYNRRERRARRPAIPAGAGADRTPDWKDDMTQHQDTTSARDALAIAFDDVAAAAERLDGHAVHTPVLRSPELDERCQAQVFFKCENLQLGGAFKFRGAFNTLSQLTAEERRRGVVAYSSGNHAIAVALAAKRLGMPATIVMPTDAP